MPEDLSELVSRRTRELGLSKSEVAKRAELSRSYIGNIINRTAPTQSGQYTLSPEATRRLAKALEIEEDEIVTAMNYLPFRENPGKPRNAAEFVQRLEEMGFDIQTNFDYEKLGPDDLQDIIDDIEAKLLFKVARKGKHN